MEQHAVSMDGTRIHWTISGVGRIAIVFIHGWLGSTRWWAHQEKYLSDMFTVVCIDLAGHGKSESRQSSWTADRYAEDIAAVAARIERESLVLVGHSMAGAFALQASLEVPTVRAVVVVDTLKDLGKLMSAAQAEEMLFRHYRSDFESAVKDLLPRFLFSPATPDDVRGRLQREFLEYNPNYAISMITPLYEMDIPAIAKRVSVPVRGINSDLTPTNRERNAEEISDFDYVVIPGTGHYPMLENPMAFNQALEATLKALEL